MAVLLDRLAAKMLENFVIRFNKPITSMTIFTCEILALKWVNSFKTSQA